ncbi:MAG TPA: methyltransferase domain-containing protein [Polyangiaceae bacterium]|nr:methyltransferase domain-containing protein [Polyangiaceae bacterium]
MNQYGRLCTEFYDLDKPEAPPDAFDFYEAFAREAGGPIHEPMCGTGRFLLPLLAQGLDITGSDSSTDMLDACRRSAARRGLKAPPVTQQLVQDLHCERAPSLMFIPSGSFGLLIEDELVTAALRRVHQVLAPGGRFLVEAELLQPGTPQTSGAWGGRWVDRPDGARLIISWLSQYSGAANVASSVHRYELVKDGQLLAQEYEDFRVRSYEPAEFRGLLERAGFERIDAHQPYERAVLSATDRAEDALVFSCLKSH